MNIGQPVRVTNGQAKPPARFTKKLEAWNNGNYLGIYLGPDPYTPGVNVQRLIEPRLCSLLVARMCGLNPANLVAIPGEPVPVANGYCDKPAFRAWCAEHEHDKIEATV